MKNNYKINDNTKDIINYLNTTFCTTKDFSAEKRQNTNTTNNKKNFRDNNLTLKIDNSYKMYFNKPSPVDKQEDSFSKVRCLLNKLSDSNYDSILESLLKEVNIMVEESTLKNILEGGEGNESKEKTELDKFAELIFELASTNAFYSKIYANLFTFLLEKFTFLNPIFHSTLENYKNSFIEIRNADPNVDYNLFCEINKENGKRKALSAFLVNLTLNKLINIDEIINLITLFLNKIHSLVNVPGSVNMVNELVENISILSNKELLDKSEDKKGVEQIYKDYSYFAICKSKDFASLPSKSIFKFMDLNDI
jgi:hypothetical protein